MVTNNTGIQRTKVNEIGVSREYWIKSFSDQWERTTFPTMITKVDGTHIETASYEIPQHISEYLQKGSQGSSSRLFIVLTAVLSSVLNRYTHSSELILGIPTPLEEDESTFESGVLPLRLNVDETISFAELLPQVGQTIRLAEANRQYSALQLASQLQLDQNSSGYGLFQTAIMLENIHSIKGMERANPDFLMIFRLDHDRITFKIRYQERNYSPELIDSIANNWISFLGNVLNRSTESLSEIDVLSEDDKQFYQNDLILDNHSRRDSVLKMFERQAELAPEQIAIRTTAEELSYKDLQLLVNGTVNLLLKQEVKQGMVVGVLANHSVHTVVTLLAIWKVGAVYLPIDANLPNERIEFMLEDSRAGLLSVQPEMMDKAEGLNFSSTLIHTTDIKSDENLTIHSEYSLEELAYIIYTSGTTGKPKGVMIEHRQLRNSIKWRHKEYALDQKDRVLQLFSPAFDGFMTSFFTPIVSGSTVIIMDDKDSKDASVIKNYIAEYKVTHFIAVPALYDTILQLITPEEMSSLRIVTLAGDKVGSHLIEITRQMNESLEIINEYGPTETSVVATFNRISSPETAGIIGKAIDETTIYIVDEKLRLLPIGCTGEILVAGVGVARGYLNRGELTAERFIQNPFCTSDSRAYKTGDLARMLPNGVIEYIGRSDNQLKINGYRIESLEIESVLQMDESVREALVLVVGEDQDKKLCAYFTASQQVNTASLEKLIRSKLPAHMVPSIFLQLDSFPLTANGKIDRKNLPLPLMSQESVTKYIEPRTPIEQMLQQIWSELLGSKHIGMKDNFFELGGQSLKGSILVARTRKAFRVDLRLRDLFENPTIEQLAKYIEKSDHLEYGDIVPVPSNTNYPLSPAQRRIYFLEQMSEVGTAYNVPMAMDITGNLNIQRVQEVIQKLVQRHEAFRTSIAMLDDLPVQQMNEHIEVNVEVVADDGKTTEEWLERFVRPFDLSSAPLLRIWLVRKTDDHHLMLFDSHHIVADGISMYIFYQEFLELYRGSELLKPAIDYKDYTAWLNDQRTTKNYQTQEQYWTEKFKGEIPLLNLPYDFERPAYQSFAGEVIQFELNTELSQRIEDFVSTAGSTAYITLLGAYSILLSKYSGQNDVIIGMSTAGRQHVDVQSMVGMFTNTLPVRSYPSGDKPFLEFISELKHDVSLDLSYQDYPFDELVSKLNLQRDQSRNPVFDTMFSLHDLDLKDETADGVTFAPLSVPHQMSKFDISLDAERRNGQFHFVLRYNQKLFKNNSMQRLVGHFKQIIEEILEQPKAAISNYSILTKDEERGILHGFNDFAADYSEEMKPIHEWFETKVKLHTNDVAVVFAEQKLTYAELNSKSNQLAVMLRQRGIGSGSFVPVLMDRSLEMVVALMAVMKSGAAFCPLDIAWPIHRIETILEDLNAPFILVNEAGAAIRDISIERIQVNSNDLMDLTEDLGISVSLDDSIYCIYTSGSTGKPKGVVVPYRGIMNRFMWMNDQFGTRSAQSVLNTTNYVYDSAVWQLFWPLINGGQTVIPHPEALMTADYFSETIEREQITVTDFVPSVFNVLVKQLEENINFHNSLNSLQTVIIGGEAITPSAVKTFLSIFPHVQCVNLYGPTEASIGCIYYSISGTEQGAIPIGKPISNVSIFILDEAKHPVPIGVPGEIYISGVCLANGYLNAADKTAEAFVTNLFDDIGTEKMYKTGDLAKWRDDGNIEFLGRVDFQVKIRGFRIELQEIERQLLACSGVKETVVTANEDEKIGKYLCAYLVADIPIDKDTLKRELGELLPAYMIPSYLIQLDEMPLSASGKVDRKALPIPDVGSIYVVEYAEPTTEIEHVLAKVWAQVLGLESVGIRDNYFEIGGDSIKALQIASRLKGHHMTFTMQELFKFPTIVELAKVVKFAPGSVSAQSVVSGNVPFTPIQKRYIERQETQYFYNQAVQVFREERFDSEVLKNSLDQIYTHHDGLRMSYTSRDGEWKQFIEDTHEDSISCPFEVFDLKHEPDPDVQMEKFSLELQQEIKLGERSLFKAALFQLPDGDYLLLAAHHMLVDGVSWRILVEDLMESYHGLQEKRDVVRLPYKTNSFQMWATEMENYAQTAYPKKELNYWRKVDETQVPSLPLDCNVAAGVFKDINSVSLKLSNASTDTLLRGIHHAYRTEINDILVAALSLAVHDWAGGRNQIRLDLEGHGRESFKEGLDVSRTVGWFTTVYPVIIDVEDSSTLPLTIRQVKERLRAIPRKGFGYGLYKYLTNQSDIPGPVQSDMVNHSEISFNYLGQLDSLDASNTNVQITPVPAVDSVSQELRNGYVLDINASTRQGEFYIQFDYSTHQYDMNTINELAELFEDKLLQIIQHCSEMKYAVPTPSDYGDSTVSLEELEVIQQACGMEIDKIYPLSPMQEGLLFHAVMDANSESYFEQNILKVSGEIDPAVFKESFSYLIDRYDIFRTAFIYEGLEKPKQIVLKQREVDIQWIDISSSVEVAEQQIYLDKLKKEDRQQGFDLSKDTLVRVMVVQTGKQSYELIWSEHHILLDGWCIAIVLKEFLEIYEALLVGKQPQLEEVIPYKNYIEWLQEQDQEQAEDFWKGYLAEFENKVTLNHTSAQKNNRGYDQDTVVVSVSEEESNLLNELSKKHSTTLNHVVQSVWSVLLHKYNDMDDLLFGAVVSGRPPELHGVEGIVGLFINTLPVRVELSSSISFSELLDIVQQSNLQAESYSYIPLSDIQRQSELEGQLFDHLFVFENHPLGSEMISSKSKSGSGFSIEDVDAFEQTNYDFNVIVLPGSQLVFRLVYNANVYDRGYVEQIGNHLQSIIRHVVMESSSPVGEIDMLTDKEKLQMLEMRSDDKGGYPTNDTIVSLFAQKAQQEADKIAIVDGDTRLTYRELDQRSNSIAVKLQEYSVITESIVGILLESSADMIVSILGVLKAGGAYMPLDPAYPKERLDYMLDNSGAQTVITNQQWSGLLENGANILSLDEDIFSDVDQVIDIGNIKPSNLAYIIYTSGTTGKPKGVMIEHQNVVQLLFHNGLAFQFSERDVWTVFHSFCFDFSVWEMYGALLYGGTVVVVPKRISRDPGQFYELLVQESVTVLNQTPTAFQNLVSIVESNGDNKLNLRYVIFGGEALKPSLLKSWKKRYPDTKLINMYGITETTVHVTYKEIGESEIESGSSNIGQALSPLRAYVLDRNRKPVPIGVPGELYIGGAGVARGYLNNSALTNDRFVWVEWSNLITPERLYRSGDMVKMLSYGEMEYLGRIDHQVKIRGHRIEIGEVESTLLKHPSVQQSIVFAKQYEDGNHYLVGYYTATNKLTLNELREYLSKFLPDYMIPAFLIQIEEVPLTSNGKIDRKLLPDPGQSAQTSENYVAPNSEDELILSEVWQAVLGLSRVGIRDNFFALGGDSIRALQIHSRLHKYNRKLEMKYLFEYPTIEQLVKFMTLSTSNVSQEPVEGEVQLTPIQHWLFEQGFAEDLNYNQALMLHRVEGFEEELVHKVLQKLTTHHDALRMTYSLKDGVVKQVNNGLNSPAYSLEVVNNNGNGYDAEEFERSATRLQKEIKINEGQLVRAKLFQMDDGDHLLLAIHHLVVDGVSWRILLEDFASLYTSLAEHREVELPLKTDSFQNWAAWLNEYSKGSRMKMEQTYWNQIRESVVEPLPKDRNAGRGLLEETGNAEITFGIEETTSLLNFAHQAYRTEINDLLVAALGITLKEWSGKSRFRLDMEGHGRELLDNSPDISRTVGWFTSLYPVLLEMDHDKDLSYIIRSTKENLRHIPNKGIGYGILKYLNPEVLVKDDANPNHSEISFNYLGQMDADLANDCFSLSPYSIGQAASLEIPRIYSIDISGKVLDHQLRFSFDYSKTQFEHSNISKLAELYKSNLLKIVAHCISVATPVLTPSDLGDKELTIEELEDVKQVVVRNIEHIYPMTPMQEGMLFHALANRESGAYFEQALLTLDGQVEVEALEQSIRHVVDQHDILRTAFLHKRLNRPRQVVMEEVSINIGYHNILHLNKVEQDKFIADFKANDINIPFELDKAPLMRMNVIHTDHERYLLVWSFHHLLLDGWCIGIVMRQFLANYIALQEGRPLESSAAPAYRTFIDWLEKQDRAEAGEYWANALEGYETETVVPYSNIELKEGYDPAELHFELDEELCEQMSILARDHTVTINTVFQAAWGVLLQKYNYGRDVVFGSVVSGRPAEVAGVETMVGLFINTIPVRVRTEKDTTFGQLVRLVQGAAVQSEKFSYYPLYNIQSASAVGDRLINHIIAFENYPMDEQLKQLGSREKTGFEVDAIEMKEQINYPFGIVVVPGKRMGITFTYNSLIYAEQCIRRIRLHFETLLQTLLKQPGVELDKVSLLTESDKQLLYFRNNTNDEMELPHLVKMFDEQVELTPDKPAIIMNGVSLSYRELHDRAEYLATKLVECGVRSETLVGMMATRSIDTAVGLLGIFKSGAAYLPLDPGLPKERITYMLEDSKATHVLLQPVFEDRFEHYQGTKVFLTDRSLDEETRKQLQKSRSYPARNDLAYVIYTSGTTGEPKGVMVEYGNISHTINWRKREYQFNSDDCVLQLFSPSFDGFMTSFLTPIVSGASVVMLSDTGSKDAREIVSTIRDYKVTHFISVPALYSAVLEILQPEQAQSLRIVTLAGDKLTADLIEKSHRINSSLEIVNEYGPTESSVVATYRRHASSSQVGSIGKGISETAVYISDVGGQPLPSGIAGEIIINGAGVARGYLHKPDLTQSKFSDDLLYEGSGRSYRTGDRGRLLANGEIEFLGRVDHQLKINGYRIEPDEIESVLLAHEDIEECVVIAKPSLSGELVLMAYYTTIRELENSQLRSYISEHLPYYMVPSYFIKLSALPLTAIGKVDRQALPDIEEQYTSQKEYTPPSSPTQQLLANIWSELLGIQKVSVQDHFFEIGGNSLKLIQMQAKLEIHYPDRISITDLFAYTTIEKLAEVLDQDEITEVTESKISMEDQIMGMLDDLDSGDLGLEEALSHLQDMEDNE